MDYDQRPIKPDKQYVQKTEAKYQQSQVRGRQYLKKNHEQKLSCFRNNKPKDKKGKQNKAKSKAQIYEQIKKRNRQKFGDWGNKNSQSKGQKQKKLNPKNMTVPYKHKQVHIDTQEYKKPDYVAKPTQPTGQEQQKLEYEKMIEYLRHQYGELEREKRQFKKVEQKLKFKQAIQKCQPIRIEVNPKVQCRTQRIQINQQPEANLENQQPNQPQFYKINPPNELDRESRYSIDSIHLHNPFSLREILKYTSIEQFHYQNNLLYQEASKILQHQRASAIVEQINGKRVSKFENGWYETWIGGKYRTGFSQKDDYKVTWYSNGDVRQELKGGKVVTYFSKKNRVNEVNVVGKDKILFFSEIAQIEMHGKERKEIRFPDGHFESVDY